MDFVTKRCFELFFEQNVFPMLLTFYWYFDACNNLIRILVCFLKKKKKNFAPIVTCCANDHLTLKSFDVNTMNVYSFIGAIVLPFELFIFFFSLCFRCDDVCFSIRSNRYLCVVHFISDSIFLDYGSLVGLAISIGLWISKVSGCYYGATESIYAGIIW